MNLMRQGIGLAQVLGLALIVGCGSSSNGHKDAGDGGQDARRDGGSLDVSEAGGSETGADQALETGAPDGTGDGVSEAGVDAPFIGDGGVDAPAVDGARDGLGDASSDGEVGPIVLMATLGGNQETPPLSTTATGTASFVLDPAMTTLTYHLVHTVANPTAAHIHTGPAGEDGPPLIPLTPVSADMSGSVTVTPAVVADLLAGNLYVNVHSVAFPAGAIRGQILLPGETLFVATLTGDQETPPAESTATGNASVILSASRDRIKYHLRTSLTPTAVHIHTAIGGLPGPVTIPLATASVVNGTASVTPTQATDLIEGRWYANVHTTLFPEGEIRGQFLLPGERLATAALSGSNLTPPVTTAASGAAAFILAYRQDMLRYEGVFTGLPGPATQVDLSGGIFGDAGVANYPLTIVNGGTGIKGVQTVLPADVAALMASPPAMFLSVHTAAHPTGEIGGPLMLHE